ncbi:MAG TPA: 5-dehydro-2-deoxygluconokinase [Acidimicrobiia bacterium]|jgi:5-dehydro-2-deoxygluconokinase|nr:5-dehydro-2-deoxygluconokinase [Acidimicrobiia bacterium]
MSEPSYDLVTMGRVNMDLYAQDIGAEFADITGFDAMVGGSPSNIAIATSRLGLQSIALTGVGDDRVGEFVLRYFRDEGVDTDYVAIKPGKLTSLALLGVQPPSQFPLSFYREDPADIHLTVADVDAVPFDEVRSIQLSGNAFSRGTCADAARHAARRAREFDMLSFLDLDLRPTDWDHAREFGITIRSILPLVDVAIGTEEEFYAALMSDPEIIMQGEPVPAHRHDELNERVEALLGRGVSAIALKRGPRGVSILLDGERIDVPGFRVDVVNTVGAGDAFAAGLIRSRLAGMEWYKAARFANACGAIEVTRHGCSAAFPTETEVMAFADDHGGL